MSLPPLPPSRKFITGLIDSLSTLPQLAVDQNAPAGTSNPLNSAPEEARKQLLTLHVLFPNELLPALDLLDRRLVARFRIRDNLSDDARDTIPQVGRAEDSNAVMGPLEQGQNAEDGSAVRTTDAALLSGMEGQEELPSAASTTPQVVGNMEAADMEMQAVASHMPELVSHSHASHGLENEELTAQEAGATAQHGVQGRFEEEGRNSNTVYYVRSAQQRSSRFSTYDITTSYEVRLHAWNCSCPAFAFAAFPSNFYDQPVIHSDIAGVQQGLGSGDGGENTEWSFGAMSLGSGTPPVCKHLLACLVVERCNIFENFVEEKEVSVDEAAGWAAGWGD